MKCLVLLLLGLFASPLVAAPEYPEMGPDIYDPRADGTALIAAALQRAQTGHKHVLVMFGANWCIWCHRLHATFHQDPKVAELLHDHYEVVLIDVNTRHGEKRNAAVNERYGNPVEKGLPVLVVLDASGRQLVTQDSGELEQGDHHDPAKILAFLAQWQPAMR